MLAKPLKNSNPQTTKIMFNKPESFTPPTCTLEINHHNSWFERCFQPDNFNKLQFKLSFDDPRVPSSQQVTITGDRPALEQLKIAVDNYVHCLLVNSAIAMPSVEGNLRSQPPRINSHPYLSPTGLVNHELWLANLNHDSHRQQITLSTVQLFDLVTALADYSTQIANRSQASKIPKFPMIPLTGAIAALALAAVGITAIWLKAKTVPNLTDSQLESSTEIPQLDEIVPPSLPKTANKPIPNPKLDQVISSRQKLPPPPAVDTPKPKPDIPDPADYPLAEIARQSGWQPSPQQDQSKAKTSPGSSVVTIAPSKIAKVEDNFSPNPTVQPNFPPAPNQLQQVTAYFEDKWQPPADLKQSLEYRIDLNQDGSIKRVIPIGKASSLYLSQTKIPVRGEAFIAPLNKTDSLTIRLLFNPDGGIQTFNEVEG